MDINKFFGENMQFGISVVNGLCFGIGMILAAAVMKLWHLGFCGG